MKKNILISIFVAGCVLLMGSCKSKTSAYQQAYEKAQDKTVGYPVVNDDVVVYSPPPVVNDDATVSTQSERISAVESGDMSELKRYSVIIYSFKNKTNANAAKDEMVKHGYRAILAQNENGMYRVVVASFDDKASAVAKRNEIKTKYAPRFNDAWILERMY